MNSDHSNTPEKSILEQISDLEQRLEKMGGLMGGRGETDPEIYLAFLRNVLEFEHMHNHPEEWSVDLSLEFRTRLKLAPDHSSLNDEEVTKALHAMILLLARFHCQLDYTNHLSDRELYNRILNEVIREPLLFGTDAKGHLWHYECCPCDDFPVWLAYYADDRERQEWARETQEPLPEKQRLKSDRDEWIQALSEKYLFKPLPKLSIPVT